MENQEKMLEEKLDLLYQHLFEEQRGFCKLYQNRKYPRVTADLAYIGGFFFRGDDFDHFVKEELTSLSKYTDPSEPNIDSPHFIEDMKAFNSRFPRFKDFFEGESYEQRKDHFNYFLNRAVQSPLVQGARQHVVLSAMRFFEGHYWRNSSYIVGSDTNNTCDDFACLTGDRNITKMANYFSNLYDGIKCQRYALIKAVKCGRISGELAKEIFKENFNTFHSLVYSLFEKVYQEVASRVKERNMPVKRFYSYVNDRTNFWLDRAQYAEPEKAVDVIKEFADFYKITPRPDKIIFDGGTVVIP